MAQEEEGSREGEVTDFIEETFENMLHQITCFFSSILASRVLVQDLQKQVAQSRLSYFAFAFFFGWTKVAFVSFTEI